MRRVSNLLCNFLQENKAFYTLFLQIFTVVSKTLHKIWMTAGAIFRLNSSLMMKNLILWNMQKNKWEGNAGISKEELHNYCIFPWKCTNSQVWKEFGWKCLVTSEQEAHFTVEVLETVWEPGKQPLAHIVALSGYNIYNNIITLVRVAQSIRNYISQQNKFAVVQFYFRKDSLLDTWTITSRPADST